MKEYAMTKHVKAEPMTLNDAKRLKGEHVVEDLQYVFDVPGYLVEWGDGLQAWVPSSYFESHFTCVDSFKDRLSAEREEAAERLGRLSKALRTEGFRKQVGDDQYALMQEQEPAMVGYIRALNRRLRQLAIEEGRGI